MLFCYCFMNSVLLKIAIIALLIAFAIDCYYPILHLNAVIVEDASSYYNK